MSASHEHDQAHVERLSLYALHALPADEVPAVEAHIERCAECREALASLRAVVASLVAWPTDVLRPPAPLWDRLAQRIGKETGQPPVRRSAPEPRWEDVSPGISVKVLATDPDNRRVTMLVRLAPGTDYPPHRHAGIEELHLLDGELLIDDRELHPGDYNRAEPGTVDHRVWSKTGCTCVLITSPDDVLR